MNEFSEKWGKGQFCKIMRSFPFHFQKNTQNIILTSCLRRNCESYCDDSLAFFKNKGLKCGPWALITLSDYNASSFGTGGKTLQPEVTLIIILIITSSFSSSIIIFIITSSVSWLFSSAVLGCLWKTNMGRWPACRRHQWAVWRRSSARTMLTLALSGW